MKWISFIVVSVLVVLCSCTKYEVDKDSNSGNTGGNTGNNSNTDNYYVKYSVSAYRGASYSVSFMTENGYATERTTGGYSRTCGPVHKGFRASISSTHGLVYIYVCKNTEPFVLKASGTSSASYTINF